MIGAENVKFQPSDVDAGDPGKLRYLHAGRPGYPEWNAKPFSQVRTVDSRACPGCMFPDAPPGKWPHTKDARCLIFLPSEDIWAWHPLSETGASE